MQRRFVLAFLFAAALAHAGSPAPLEARKIEYLIRSVETLENAEFVRNGTAYEAKAAAEDRKSVV